MAGGDDKGKGKRKAPPTSSDSNTEERAAASRAAQLARRMGISRDAALRLLLEQAGSSRQHDAVRRVLGSTDLVGRMADTGLSSRDMAGLAASGRSQRDAVRGTSAAATGDVTDTVPRRLKLTKYNMTIGSTRLDKPGRRRRMLIDQITRAHGEERPHESWATRDDHAFFLPVRRRLKEVLRVLDAAGDPAARDVRLFLETAERSGRFFDGPDLYNLLNRLSSRALYMIVHAYTSAGR